ncbi:Glucan endo-1,3-beta-D-glucosidase [Actinidia chinensis var. chinensis]|uniref:Glucan endo-1,3-beta-D-glucosidase n=1 Tax=Actinidia chinensis var. chinensis TaxID=1590841 RepID=A0A2R6RFW1_ACTCC|nr:Glucan endo-1,3-beta-D-glucosidase [Actinidia chinensis var. chinensis]
MARANLSFCFLCFLLCIVVSTSSRDATIWADQKRNVATSWCIASPFVGDDKLQGAIKHYCSNPEVDCNVIQPGGPCYVPNTVKEHASVVLNLYYKAHLAIRQNCPSDVGFLTVKDPSSGSCHYP